MSKKRRLPPHAVMVNNLTKLYHSATIVELKQGKHWYTAANEIVREFADQYRLPDRTVAAVIAAVSPQCSWEANVRIAEDVLKGTAKVSHGAIKRNVEKAFKLSGVNIQDDTMLTAFMQSYFPTGPKVLNFALNLAGDLSKVTIDAHSLQAAVSDPTWSKGFKPSDYEDAVSAYKDAARLAGLPPAVFQAVVWLIWKRQFPAGIKRALKRERRAHGAS